VIPRSRRTGDPVRRRARPLLWGAVAIMALAECTSVYPTRQSDFDPRSPAGLTAAPDRDRTAMPPANDSARTPIDPGARSADDTQPRTTRTEAPPEQAPPQRDEPARRLAAIDPGAAAVIDSIEAMAGQLRQGEDGVSRIGLTALRNQSRSTRDEFQAMRQALMETLTRAGRRRRIVFTDAQEMAVQYYLEGAAYRLDEGAAGRWELFLHLRQEEDGLTIWEPAGPLRVAMEADGSARILEER